MISGFFYDVENEKLLYGLGCDNVLIGHCLQKRGLQDYAGQDCRAERCWERQDPAELSFQGRADDHRRGKDNRQCGRSTVG